MTIYQQAAEFHAANPTAKLREVIDYVESFYDRESDRIEFISYLFLLRGFHPFGDLSSAVTPSTAPASDGPGSASSL